MRSWQPDMQTEHIRPSRATDMPMAASSSRWIEVRQKRSAQSTKWRFRTVSSENSRVDPAAGGICGLRLNVLVASTSVWSVRLRGTAVCPAPRLWVGYRLAVEDICVGEVGSTYSRYELSRASQKHSSQYRRHTGWTRSRVRRYE